MLRRPHCLLPATSTCLQVLLPQVQQPHLVSQTTPVKPTPNCPTSNLGHRAKPCASDLPNLPWAPASPSWDLSSKAKAPVWGGEQWNQEWWTTPRSWRLSRQPIAGWMTSRKAMAQWVTPTAAVSRIPGTLLPLHIHPHGLLPSPSLWQCSIDPHCRLSKITQFPSNPPSAAPLLPPVLLLLLLQVTDPALRDGQH